MSHPRLAMFLLFVAVVGMVDPAVATATSSARGHRPPLLDCGPAPILSKNDDATFRADLATAIGALPSIVATVPEAFAIVSIGSAVARGVCFGANVSASPVTGSACEACLSAAARDATGICGASSGRAGVWHVGCFVSYADSDAPSSREEAFHGWFYAAPSTSATVADGGACSTDRVVDCNRCLHDSALVASALGWWQKIHGEKVIVVGYNCFLRVRISTLPKGPEENAPVRSVTLTIWLNILFVAAADIVVIMFFRIIRIVHGLPHVNAG